MVIVLWVSGTFLTYAIFSDDSYSKPYFVTYIGTSVFVFYLIPWAVREGPSWWRKGGKDGGSSILGRGEYFPVAQEADAAVSMLGKEGKLGIKQTMRLSAEFCLMWFVVSFFVRLFDCFVGRLGVINTTTHRRTIFQATV